LPYSIIELGAKNKGYDRNDNRNKKEAYQPCGKQLPLFQDYDPYGDSRYSYESEDASHLVTQDIPREGGSGSKIDSSTNIKTMKDIKAPPIAITQKALDFITLPPSCSF
jgi:hypothetical protein